MKKFKLPLVIACVAVVMVTMVVGAGIERERTTPADNISDTETETICETEAPKSEETTTKEVAEETEQIETTEPQTTTTTKTPETTKSVSKVENNPIDTPKPEPKTEPKTETTKAPEVKSSYIGSLKVTGYTDEEGFTYGSATASGVPIGEGMCALNNTQRQELGIYYGDKIYIEGLGTYTVVDCGCRYGVVDVWFWTNAEAYAVTGYYDVYYN